MVRKAAVVDVKRVPKRRQSPGGVIYCPDGHGVSRRRYNAALRFRQVPTCPTCGSTDLLLKGQHELKRGRMVWKKKGRTV